MKMLLKSEAITGENTLCAGAGSIAVTRAASPTSRIWPRTQNSPPASFGKENAQRWQTGRDAQWRPLRVRTKRWTSALWAEDNPQNHPTESQPLCCLQKSALGDLGGVFRMGGLLYFQFAGKDIPRSWKPRLRDIKPTLTEKAGRGFDGC